MRGIALACVFHWSEQRHGAPSIPAAQRDTQWTQPERFRAGSWHRAATPLMLQLRELARHWLTSPTGVAVVASAFITSCVCPGLGRRCSVVV